MWTGSRIAIITLACSAGIFVQPYAVAATTDLGGTWTFDTYLSDNPQQVAAAMRADLGQNEFAGFSGSPEGGRYGRGMGRRGRSSEGSNRPTPAPNAEQQVPDAITRPLRYPPTTLRISQSDGSVTIADEQGQSRTFQTNDKREPQTFDTARADTTARWEGPNLVIDFDLGKGRKMTYTYSIVPTTHQLLVRIGFERAPKDPGAFEIRFAYNRATGD